MGVEHHSIMEVKRYVDNGGREVAEFTQVFGQNKKAPFYKGMAVLRIQPVSQQGVPMPIQTVPFEFHFPDDTTLKKAFDTFDVIAKAEVERQTKLMKEKAAANRVVAANAMPTLIGPDGKPMKG